ncbi:6-phosphogluconolactonase [soil metagenome]
MRPGFTVEVCDDGEAAAGFAAELVATEAAGSIEGGGSFTLALSGGRTPRRMLELLDPTVLAGDAVTTFQVDERIAPDDDPDRNLTQVREALSATALDRVRPMPVTDGDLEAAATRYASELPDSLDLVHLGLGPDGHTASLVPGDSVLEIDDRLVALTGGEYQGRRRMTLTYPALAAARKILWLVTGGDKREALRGLLEGDESIPAGRVVARSAVVVCDRAARG